MKKIIIALYIATTFILGVNTQHVSAETKTSSATATLEIMATAYAPGPHDNGKWGNLTYMGTKVRPGIIAVDPKLIPLGSRVRIEFTDGRTVEAIAEDTGGAIKGNRIDIAMQTVAEAYKFGMQKVKVTVLE